MSGHQVEVAPVRGTLTFGWACDCTCGWSTDIIRSPFAAHDMADEHERTGE